MNKDRKEMLLKCSSTSPNKPWGLSDFQIPSRQICSPHNSQVKRKWTLTWSCTPQAPFPKEAAGLSWLWTLLEGSQSPLMCGGEHSLGWYSYLHPQFTFLRNHMKDRGTAESLLNVLKKTLIEDSITIMMTGIDDNEQNTCRLAHLPGSSQALGHLKLRSCFLSWEWLRNSCVANQETWFTHHLSCTRSPEEINE